MVAVVVCVRSVNVPEVGGGSGQAAQNNSITKQQQAAQQQQQQQQQQQAATTGANLAPASSQGPTALPAVAPTVVSALALGSAPSMDSVVTPKGLTSPFAALEPPPELVAEAAALQAALRADSDADVAPGGRGGYLSLSALADGAGAQGGSVHLTGSADPPLTPPHHFNRSPRTTQDRLPVNFDVFSSKDGTFLS
jgi:hypothetical protein